MRKIGIFELEQNKYTDYYQCITCEKHFNDSDINNIWLCKTCSKDICESCKDVEHANCDKTKDTNQIVLSHPKDCDCRLCDDPYGFYYGVPIVF